MQNMAVCCAHSNGLIEATRSHQLCIASMRYITSISMSSTVITLFHCPLDLMTAQEDGRACCHVDTEVVSKLHGADRDDTSTVCMPALHHSHSTW